MKNFLFRGNVSVVVLNWITKERTTRDVELRPELEIEPETEPEWEEKVKEKVKEKIKRKVEGKVKVEKGK